MNRLSEVITGVEFNSWGGWGPHAMAQMAQWLIRPCFH